MTRAETLGELEKSDIAHRPHVFYDLGVGARLAGSKAKSCSEGGLPAWFEALEDGSNGRSGCS
jgi:hypothetical protein